jgi:DeoR/GlpR family transcriptional regulator of sugar metabolism
MNHLPPIDQPTPHLTEQLVVDFLLHPDDLEIDALVHQHIDHCDECADALAYLTELQEAETQTDYPRFDEMTEPVLVASGSNTSGYFKSNALPSIRSTPTTSKQTKSPSGTLAAASRMVSAAERGWGARAQNRTVYIQPGKTKPQHYKETTMSSDDTGSNKKDTIRVQSWANLQRESDMDRKNRVATWAVRYFRLQGASGVYFDSGTSATQIWEALGRQIGEGGPSQLQVVTNNLMILNHFANDPSPLLFGTRMESVGEFFDVLHQSFYGPGIAKRFQSGTFRPDIVYIGTNGISFGPDGAILFGYHASEPEREVKELLFANPCRARKRVILATGKKIGNPGGTVFDILKLEHLDLRSPLYLVTTPPEPDEREMYEEALQAYQTDMVQEAISKSGLQFTWLEVRGPNPGDEYDITQAVKQGATLMERDM